MVGGAIGRDRMVACDGQQLLRAVAIAVGASFSFGWLLGVSAQEATSNPITDQDVQYIWPIVLWNIPLVGVKDAPIKGPKKSSNEVTDPSLTDALIFEELAMVAEKGFKNYIDNILPRELEIDKPFAEEFANSDASRMNVGFLRWQKRVFHENTRIPIEELDWDGKPCPKHKGINYKWKEFYDSEYMRMLTYKVKQTGSAYLNSLGDREKRKFRVFPWVEVYGPRDFQRPHMHTGASVSATFIARSKSPGAKLMFEDVRGINPPFGRKHEIEPTQGELVLHPAWASHMIMPNEGNGTSVYINFLLWPPNGAPDFDWEDDITGDYIYKKKTKIKAKPPGGVKSQESIIGRAPSKTEL